MDQRTHGLDCSAGMVRRVQRKRLKGWQSPPNTRSVCRPGRFGNPFATAKAYRDWLVRGEVDRMQLLDQLSAAELRCRRFEILSALHEIRRQNLSCFCPLDGDCHADVLLDLANRRSDWITDGGELTAFGAVFSDDRRYRYTLWRRWSFGGDNLCAFIGLNPSTADEFRNDPTVTRCIRRAQQLGHSGMVMLNLFGYRATDPRDMKRFPEPIGWQNDQAILDVCREAGRVICAWGAHGEYQGRAEHVLGMLKRNRIAVYHLGLTQAGHPRHPLYLRNDLVPERWEI